MEDERRETERRARFEALRADIRVGIESGPGIPADEVFDKLEAKYGKKRY